jgi:hypothetical protein
MEALHPLLFAPGVDAGVLELRLSFVSTAGCTRLTCLPGIIIVALATMFVVRPGWPQSAGQFSGGRW